MSPTAGSPMNPFVQWGPGLGDVLATGGGSMFMPLRKSEAIFSIAGDVERIQAADLVDDTAVSGQLRVCRRRHALLHLGGGEAGRRRARVFPAVGSIEDGGRGRVARLRRLRHPLAVGADRADQRRASSSARSISKRCRQTDPGSGARHLVRHVRVSQRAAAVGAELGERVHRQLRLVDHRAHVHHQRGDVPASAQEQRVDAQDAGRSSRR